MPSCKKVSPRLRFTPLPGAALAIALATKVYLPSEVQQELGLRLCSTTLFAPQGRIRPGTRPSCRARQCLLCFHTPAEALWCNVWVQPHYLRRGQKSTSLKYTSDAAEQRSRIAHG